MKIKYQNGNIEKFKFLTQVDPLELTKLIKQSDAMFKELLTKNLLRTNVQNHNIKSIYSTDEKSHKHYIVLRENNIGEIFACGYGRVLTSHDVVNVVL
jgi:hypothetical protein